MQYQEISLESFFVAGISVRTTNQNNQSAGDIGALWQRFSAEAVQEKISHKLSDHLYCVYTGYESRDEGWYRTLLGYRVPSLQQLPQGCTGIEVPAARYYRFRSTGPVPECVLRTWQFIWTAQLDRLFAADFDVYPPGMKAQQETVTTYLSVR